MNLHTFDPATGEYQGPAPAQESPLEPGTPLVPLNGTLEAPPECPAGHVPVWGGLAWQIVPDYRGQAVFWRKEDGSPVEIGRPGPLAGFDSPQLTREKPPAVPDGKMLVWKNTKWALKDKPLPPPPDAITMRQARLALLKAGQLAAVNAAIADMPGEAGEAARIEWEYAQEVRRDNPLIAALAARLGLDEAALGNLFRGAAGL